MDYRLELLHDSEFEQLVNTICQKVLGTGSVSFAEGKDGGKDGKFIGTAQNFPSTASPWNGKFIIQAKHTSNPIASFSDSSFETLINGEIKKIKELKENNQIDNYILFTNRKYTGVKGDDLVEEIKKQTGLDNVILLGKETINNGYLNPNKDIVRQYKLDIAHIPFSFSDEEIKTIIIGFNDYIKSKPDAITSKSEELRYDFSHIEKDKKNKKNQLSEDYYKQHILENSLQEFDKISSFLNNPINEELMDYYYDTVAELNQMITLKRDNYDAFEELFVFIYRMVCDGQKELLRKKRHVMTFLHYMYVECEIGKK